MKPHELFREPGLGLPFLALSINIAVICWAWWIVMPAKSSPRITLLSQNKFSDPQATTIEILPSGDALLNGRMVPGLSELNSQLRVSASTQSGAVIKVPQSLPSAKLVEILGLCNRAGYTELAISVLDGNTTAAAQ